MDGSFENSERRNLDCGPNFSALFHFQKLKRQIYTIYCIPNGECALVFNHIERRVVSESSSLLTSAKKCLSQGNVQNTRKKSLDSACLGVQRTLSVTMIFYECVNVIKHACSGQFYLSLPSELLEIPAEH